MVEDFSMMIQAGHREGSFGAKGVLVRFGRVLRHVFGTLLRRKAKRAFACSLPCFWPWGLHFVRKKGILFSAPFLGCFVCILFLPPEGDNHLQTAQSPGRYGARRWIIPERENTDRLPGVFINAGAPMVMVYLPHGQRLFRAI